MDEALLALERATRAAPQDPGAWFRLGAAHRRAGRIEAATQALQAALALDPAHGGAATELDHLPGLARGPWPTEDGDPSGARRSPFPGARRGVVLGAVELPSPPRGAPVVAARGEAYVATIEGVFRVTRDGGVALVGPPDPQRGPPVLGPEGQLVLLPRDGDVAVCDASGRITWREELGSRAFEPIVADDLVLVGVENRGLVALELESGHHRWTLGVEAESFSRPTLGADGRVYVAARGDRPLVVRGYGETWRWQLHALDRRGLVGWSSASRPERDTGTPHVPSVSPDGETIFVRVDAELLAVRARDGTVSGSALASGSVAVGPDGVARAVRGERLVGVDGRGNDAWEGDRSAAYLGGRVAIDSEGTTFVATNDRVAAIGKSGGFLWACAVRRVTSRPAIGNGCLLVTSFHERTLTWIG